eukprot:jgi/Bigna1/76632/fgenesh1_pg.42_\
MEVEKVDTPSKDAAGADEKKIHLDVLTTVKDSQSQYGLRGDDYTRYRQYCAKRLKRVRKSVKFQHGKGHFKKKKLEVKHVKNNRFLSIPLLNAERAWSYAMELKQALTKDDDSRKQHHLLKKLKKAVAWSKKLGTDRTQLESDVYASWMAGINHNERAEWKDALTSLLHAKTLCEQLAKVSDVETEDRCNDMAKQIGQSLRLAKYNAKRELGGAQKLAAVVEEATKLAPEIKSKFEILEKAHETKSSSTAATTAVVSFMGSKIPISNANTRAALDRAATKEAALKSSSSSSSSSDHIHALTQIIADYTKAHGSCQRDIYANEGAKLRTIMLDKKAGYLKLLKSYIDYKKLTHKFSRGHVQTEALATKYDEENKPGVVLKGKAKKERVQVVSLISAYNSLLREVKELERFAEERKDGDERKRLETKRMCYRAIRLFYKATSFENNRKFLEAFALFDRSTEVAKEASAAAAALGEKDPGFSRLETLVSLLPAKRLRAKALVLQAKYATEKGLTKGMANMDISDTKKTEAPLLDRLDKFESTEDKELTKFPEVFKAAPGKALFFDVAYNELSFDSLGKRLEAEKQKSGGLLSSLGLW